MTKHRALKRQMEQLLDLNEQGQLNVIVQMDGDQAFSRRLSDAAGLAVSRRRLALNPRDLLPRADGKQPSARIGKETASTKTLLDDAKREAFALKRIQESGLNGLMANPIVQKAIAGMLEPARKSARAGEQPSRFWTSRAMPLRLNRDDLAKLPDAVPGIRSININRHLSLPNVAETRQSALETEELLDVAWGLERSNALAAWGTYGARGKGVKIGLLDTGVDADHPDLKGKVSDWAEFDGNGYPVPGSKAHDSDEHGTHCAGTLVGDGASGRHIGVAPDATIAAGLVLNGAQGGTDAQVLAGIDWAAGAGVDVLSLSLGGLVMDPETPPTYMEAMLSCVEIGIPVVAAIGNEGEQTTGSPGNNLFSLSVGATDHEDRVAGFSGGRTQIIYESDYIAPEHLPLPYSKPDLTAPGVAIYSSVPGGGYKSISGTSMAAPHVAGAIALLLSATTLKRRASGMDLSSAIQDFVTGSVCDLGESGQDHRYGFGRLDVLRMIGFAKNRGY